MALVPRVFLPAEQIQNRVREMGEQISANYPEGPLYLISVLKGAFIFMADLSRHIKTPSRIEFMGISSYGRGKTSSGEVKVTKDLDVSIEGHHVLIVEDIVDSGVPSRLRSPPCWISPRSVCVPCKWLMSVSRSPTNSWSAMGWTSRKTTGT
jgi:hypoxanthine-guanine phosphoribosyltransferase